LLIDGADQNYRLGTTYSNPKTVGREYAQPSGQHIFVFTGSYSSQSGRIMIEGLFEISQNFS